MIYHLLVVGGLCIAVAYGQYLQKRPPHVAAGVSQLAHYEEEVRARAESTSSLSDPDKVWFVVYS